MDFFQQQHEARRASHLLVWLFVAAVAVLILLVNLGFFCLYTFWHLKSTAGVSGTVADYITSPTCLITSLLTLAVILTGSIRRYSQLHKNDVALADLMNATEITLTTAASDEKQLINVVEEMAVAAGIPPPRLFVMREEPAINAFVAGLPGRQLLVVTQGTLDQLTRDELQGVIGHEFSHLLNGDGLLNLRMMALLAGLLTVGRLGLYLISLGWPEQQLRSHMEFERRIGADVGSSNSRGNVLFVLAGCLLAVAGYAGLFIGRLIKAAISRQREALADASSRQFTRNPAGLGGALIKIKNGPGSLLNHPHAEDINHMCFGDSVLIHWHRLLATHPDIDTRLREIDPSWITRARVRQRQQQPVTQPAATTAVSIPENVQLGYARSLLAGMPETLSQQLHDPVGACLVIYALLMDVEKQRFLPAVTATDKQKLPALVEQIDALGSRTRLPLIDLALPALQRLEPPQLKQLLTNIDWLIKADGKVTLFEYLLRELVRKRLQLSIAAPVTYTRFDQLAGSLQLLLSMLIHYSSQDAAAQQKLFQSFAAPLLPNGRQLIPLERCSLKALTQSLAQVHVLTPLLKKTLLDTCADIILADGKVQVEEAELLRLICLLADCPVPPLTSSPDQQP